MAAGIDSVLSDSAFVGGVWSVKVVDLAQGRTLFSRNAEINLLPASNAKMYTTAAALEQLGPSYRHRTTLVTNGQIRSDTLFGDIIVRGSGDPSFSGEFHDGNSLAPLQAWADTLRELGISVITGDVIGDDNRFDDEPLGRGWMWDDEPYESSAQISALSINNNCVELRVSPTIPGSPARIEWSPANTDYVAVVNRTETVAKGDLDRERYARARASNRIEVLSTVAMGEDHGECIAIENPTLFFAHLLRQSIRDRGIAVLGSAIDIDDLVEPPLRDPAERVLARYASPPLADLASSVNKPSNNLHAELMLRTLGVERPVADSTIGPGTALMGAEAAARTFVAAGIDTTRLRLADGSGLSRYHLMTTSMTVSLLSYMWHHPDPAVREAFVESLPVAGVDGTLESRYPEGRARGNVRAKTGTMTSVSSLGGYVWSISGRPFAFAMMCNNYTSPTPSIRSAQDRITTILANLP